MDRYFMEGELREASWERRAGPVHEAAAGEKAHDPVDGNGDDGGENDVDENFFGADANFL